ncbi:MAG TPA: S26 family signal peptidase [Rudaea sp.]|jgi:conjugative transfer signal peptidase TraF|nr:S26 family signal peptidase [Rudaea sp.]
MKANQYIRLLRLLALACVLVVLAYAAGALIRLSGHALYVNDSPSMPRGVYWIRMGAPPTQRGEVVVFRPLPAFAHLIYGRGWLPRDMPLIKPVGGTAGDIYCAIDGRFLVNGEDAGPMFDRDAQGAVVPQMAGCHRVARGTFLPVSSYIPRSFDGRYMGAVPAANVIGTGVPLLTF